MTTKKPKTRTQVCMVLRLSFPAGTSAAQARNEVKYLVKDQAFWSLDSDQVKFLSCRAPRRR